MSMRRLAAALGALSVLVAACSNDGGVDSRESNPIPTADPQVTGPDGSAVPGDPTSSQPTGSGPDEPAAAPIEWEPYADNVEVGTLTVPVDYDDPSKGTFELYLARHLAAEPEERIGSLLINPGGPGVGGAVYAINAELQFTEQLVDRFDIIGWDPRGTGQSTPAIDCIDDYDHYFAGTDITPDDPAEKQQLVDLAEEFTGNCVSKNEAILPYVGTNNSAIDIDSIRRSLGEEEVSYFGFSYGSRLGATWATMFPGTVRAAVFDGAADPTSDYNTDVVQQAQGFDMAIDNFLALCSADDDCAFHNDGDAEGAFDALMSRLDAQPIPTAPGRPDLTRSMAMYAVVEAMYTDAYWPALERSLADAANGDGAGMLALYDQYLVRDPGDGTYSNLMEAFRTIYCMDSPERFTVAEDDANALRDRELAPRYSQGTVGDYFCTFYPPSTDPRIPVTGVGAGPIVVIGTTGDPATPLESTRVMADTLEDGRLVIVQANAHGGYRENDCVDDIVHDYFIDLTVPAVETECR